MKLSELMYAAVLEAWRGSSSNPSVLQALREVGFKLGLLTNVGSYDPVKLR